MISTLLLAICGRGEAQQKNYFDQFDVHPPRAAAEVESQLLQNQHERLKLERLRNTPLRQPPKSGAQVAQETMQRERASAMAKAAAAKEFSLPSLGWAASNAFRSAQDLLAHPGFEAATGLPNPFKGGFGIFNVPGTDAGDFQKALASAVALGFTPAFASLRDAGVITKAQYERTLTGLANLGNGMSEDQFRRQLQLYVDKIAQGLDVARKQAAMGSSPFTYEDLLRERQRRNSLPQPSEQ